MRKPQNTDDSNPSTSTSASFTHQQSQQMITSMLKVAIYAKQDPKFEYKETKLFRSLKFLFISS